MTKEILLKTFDCRLKGELFFIWMERSPSVISDTGLIIRVSFAAIPKFYTDNTSNLQKLIHYWFSIPILHSNFTISRRSLQSSLQNREIPSHPLSTPPLLPAHGWSSCTYAGGGSDSSQMRQLRSGLHALPSCKESDACSLRGWGVN
jgi:hypothetical protein